MVNNFLKRTVGENTFWENSQFYKYLVNPGIKFCIYKEREKKKKEMKWHYSYEDLLKIKSISEYDIVCLATTVIRTVGPLIWLLCQEDQNKNPSLMTCYDWLQRFYS